MAQYTIITGGTTLTGAGEFAGDIAIGGETISVVGDLAVPCGATVKPIAGGPLHDATEIGPTAIVFTQSDPPISHVAIEDSPRDALTAAVDT
jgi:N-carbamoyl-L-amino-acid hydrolase